MDPNLSLRHLRLRVNELDLTLFFPYLYYGHIESEVDCWCTWVLGEECKCTLGYSHQGEPGS
jgi:hypothetical protein